MKKLIPPHPPFLKGGEGDLKTIFAPTLTSPIQGEGIHLGLGGFA